AIETTAVSDHSVRCKVEVRKKEGVAVVDTGSLKTFLPEEMVEMDAPMTSFTMADGVSKLWTRGPIEMEFSVAGVTFVHPIYLREAKEAIIGSDLLDKYGGVVVHGHNKSLKFLKPPKPIESNVEMPIESETRSPSKQVAEQTKQTRCNELPLESSKELMKPKEI